MYIYAKGISILILDPVHLLSLFIIAKSFGWSLYDFLHSINYFLQIVTS